MSHWQSMKKNTQLARFVAGEELSKLVPLREYVGALATVRTCEIGVEQKMSLITAIWSLAPHAQPAYVNSKLRFPEFVAELEQHPQDPQDSLPPRDSMNYHNFPFSNV